MGRLVAITPFLNPEAIVRDPVQDAQRVIERDDREYQNGYNNRVKELRAIRNELSACIALQRDLPARISNLSGELDRKLAALQQYVAEGAKKGRLLEI